MDDADRAGDICAERPSGHPSGSPFDIRHRKAEHLVRAVRLLAIASLLPAICVALSTSAPTSRVGRPAVAHITTVDTSQVSPLDDSGLPSAVTYSWGSDDWGQLGVGATGAGTPTPVDQPAPVSLTAGVNLTSVAAGGAHVLGLTSAGQIETWGANDEGQLGVGSTLDSDTPVTADTPGGVSFSAVAAGSSHSLALTASGEIYAWGSNVFGQLGNGSDTASDIPVPVDGPDGVVFTAIAAGGDHSLALSSTGQVYAWGANFGGQLGDGTTTSADVPTLVTAPPDTDFVAIAAGTAHSLALSSTGQVYAWGYNASGQLGDDTDESSSTMTAVTFPPGVLISAIACGADHSLALSSTGAVYEWGSDVFGQLDTALVDDAPVDSPVPVQPLGLPPLTTFVAVAGGLDSSYAVTSAGVVWTWGGNPDGQLGSGPPGVNAVLPAPLDSLPAGALATGVFSGPDAAAAFLVTRADQQLSFPQLPAPTYGDPPVDLAPTASSGLPVSAQSSGACVGPAAHVSLVAAGTCTVSASQAGSFSYYPTAATATFTVAPATVGILPDDATATAGSPLPPFGYRLSGLRNGDPKSVVVGQASCATTADVASPPGDYPITCTTGTLHAANYVFAVAGAATLDLDAPESGYALIGADGSVWALGPARLGSAPAPPFYGSMAGHVLDAPVVGGAFTPLHGGYWLVASDGGIFAFGNAAFHGSMGGRPLNRPIVGVASTPDGHGYWQVASDGGIFAFGDAGFYGSTGSDVLNRPIVGMASTPDGRGYWLVAADGGIFAFGDAGFYGSTGGEAIGQRVVGMAAAPGGQGYWLTTASGSVFPFGRAAFEGSLRFLDLGFPVVGIAATGNGGGYWLVASDGGVFAFGDAGFYGRAVSFPGTVDGVI